MAGHLGGLVIKQISFIIFMFSGFEARCADSVSVPADIRHRCLEAFGERGDVSTVERLQSFVALNGRLPAPNNEGERSLYGKLYWLFSDSRANELNSAPEVVALMRREWFYRAAFLAVVSKADLNREKALVSEKQRIELFRSWGDDPFPADDTEFQSLIKAQSERRNPADGKRIFDDLNQFVAEHGRLPKNHENNTLRTRFREALAEPSPPLLQLSDQSMSLLRETLFYRRRKAEFEVEWERSPKPPTTLRFRAAVWRLLDTFDSRESGTLADKLNAFVKSKNRLPGSFIKEERPLYKKMLSVVKEGNAEGRNFSPELITLIRRELFYRNGFISLVSDLYSDSDRSTVETRRMELHRQWGDDPYPEDGNVNYVPLIMAQAERVQTVDGKRTFDDLNLFVKIHGRLPKAGELDADFFRIAKALTANSPSLLQLSPEALSVLKPTLAYRRHRAKFMSEREMTRSPSANLQFRATIWHLLDRS